MGDVAWLTGLFTAVAGLVTYLVRWIVRREREISGENRETAMTALGASKQMLANQERMLATQERIIANQERHGELLWRILDSLERSDVTGRHRGGDFGNGSSAGRPSVPPSDWRNDSPRTH